MLKNILNIVTAVLISAFCSSCSRESGGIRYTTIEGSVWHTEMHVTYGSDRDLSDSVLAITAEVEQSLSPFLTDSRISRINRNEDMAVDRHITEVFAEAQRVNSLSGGMFDPTVAPLVNLWGFGYETGEAEPTAAQIDSCRQLVGIAECSVTDGVMVKKDAGTQFNFSAITKGYGIDCIAAMMQRNGIGDYMIEIGGEIALRGVNARGEKWHIQIDAPGSGREGHDRLSVIEATDCCIATSGNYRNYRDTGSGRIGHTISPVTGRPVMSEVLSATVIAPTAMTADALATSLMAMAPEAGIAMIEALPSTEALLIIADGPGYRTVTTPSFPLLNNGK